MSKEQVLVFVNRQGNVMKLVKEGQDLVFVNRRSTAVMLAE